MLEDEISEVGKSVTSCLVGLRVIWLRDHSSPKFTQGQLASYPTLVITELSIPQYILYYTYALTYLLGFGLKQRLCKVPGPPAATERTIPAAGAKFLFSCVATYGSVFHGIH